MYGAPCALLLWHAPPLPERCRVSQALPESLYKDSGFLQGGSLGAEATSRELTGHLGPKLSGPRPRRESTIGVSQL